jgi:hypothetical protein
VRVDQLPEAEQDLGAPAQRRLAPLGEGGLRRGHRRVDVGLGGEHDLVLLLAGGRVEDGSATVSADPAAADPVLDG